MYCRKCGKEIESGEYCLDCLGQTQSQDQTEQVVKQVVVEPTEVKQDNTIGRKGALAATILGAISYFVIMFGYGFAMGGLQSIIDYGPSAMQVFEIVIIVLCTMCIIASTILSIIALVKGISSIGVFKKAKAQGNKPVPTLILGIIGTALSAMSLLFVCLTAFMLLPLMML